MENTDEVLTSIEMGETLKYFDAFNQAFSGMPFYSIGAGNYYTPDLINSAMKMVNNNPSVPSSSDSIVKALANPNNSEQILRNYATYFEINNIFYKRLLNFNSDMMAWNLTFDCTNIEDESDFNSKEFKDDLKVVDSFCSKTNMKQSFKTIVNQILRQGVYYGVFRDEGDQYCWQELPPDYCKITGNSNFTKLFSFDFTYFLNRNGTNIDMYPKVFKKLLKQVYNQISGDYNPKGDIDKRHSSFIYWIDVSPKDNFFCFTLDDGISALIPYYSGLFPDLYLQPLMRELEKNKAMIAAQKLLVNLLETYNTAKSGTVPNQYVITPKDIGQFMSLVKTALGDTIKAVAMPAKSTEVVDFNVEAQNRNTTYQSNIATSAVSSSESLYSDTKLNVLESELALNIDENFINALYPQFENFLNYYINKHTNKFKFKFKLQDMNNNVNRKNRVEKFTKLATMGIVDIGLYARSTDQNVFEAQRSLQYTKSIGMEKLLTSLMSLNNQSNETGRPEDTSSRNDSTIASKERGSNDLADST